MLAWCKGARVKLPSGCIAVLPVKCGFGSQPKKSSFIVFGCLWWNLLAEVYIASAAFLQVLTGTFPKLLADVQ